jgi:hypothetical protein
MSWENVLKMMIGRQFMEALQEKLGGTLSGGMAAPKHVSWNSPTNRESRELNYEGGSIRLDLQKDTKYKVNVNGKIFLGYNLKQMLEKVMTYLESDEQ